MSRDQDLLSPLLTAARQAGRLIMEIYDSGFVVRDKADQSPVTAADEQAEAYLLAVLAELTPDIPVISEEAAAAGTLPTVGDCFWLVDPLDGTKEFIKRNGEFTVNIGLIRNLRPVLGVIHAPAMGRSFWGVTAQGEAPAQAWEQREGEAPRPLSIRIPPAEGLTITTSRSHRAPERLEAFLAKRAVAGHLNAGSSLKFCLIAAGEADCYPRLGPTCEWDICAGQAILEAAGGSVVQFEDGKPMVYGKAPKYLNPDFIAWGHQG